VSLSKPLSFSYIPLTVVSIVMFLQVASRAHQSISDSRQTPAANALTHQSKYSPRRFPQPRAHVPVSCFPRPQVALDQNLFQRPLSSRQVTCCLTESDRHSSSNL